MLTGSLLAVLAALGSGTGSVLESLGVQRAGAFGGGHAALAQVARQPLYWAGIVVDLVGFVSAAVALHHLPLFLVQSVLAFSVGVTAVISRFLGVRLPRPGWIALGVAACGLVMVGVSAQPGRADELPALWRVLLVAVAAVVALVVVLGPRIRSSSLRTVVVSFGAGLGFSAVAVSARTMPAVEQLSDVLGEPAAWGIAANGVAATVAFARALQLGSATAVSAVLFTTNTVIPSAIGLLVLDDRIRPGSVPLGAVGFVLAVSGAVAVAHWSARATTVAGAPVAGPPVAHG